MQRISRSRGPSGLILVTSMALCLLATPLAWAAKGGGGSAAYIRVDQVGVPMGTAFRSYLMSTGVETGATWTLKRGSITVASGNVGADLGSWSASFPHVYAIDVPGQATAGTYSLSVAGPIAATSPSFAIDTGSAVDAAALRNALGFYQVQRDGPNFIPSALRTAAGHLNDQAAMTYLVPSYNAGSGRFSGDLTATGVRIDASGGWFDAGDYLKFVMATSYAESLLLTGVRDFPAQMGRAPVPLTSRQRGGSARTGCCGCGMTRRDALLPGRHRDRQREDARRPRHLAAAPGGRHLRRHEPRLPLHPEPTGVPRRTPRLADQPEPGGS